MHDLTEDVAAAVAHSNIKTGVVNIFNVGSTAAVGTIEFEPGLEKDLPAILNKLIPPSRNYGHEQAWHDGNGHLPVRDPVGIRPTQERLVADRHVSAQRGSGMRAER